MAIQVPAFVTVVLITSVEVMKAEAPGASE